jgi:hypothetical protein
MFKKYTLLQITVFLSTFWIQPTLADVIPGQFIPDPGRPDWNGINSKYDNSDQQVLGGAGPEIIYDTPVTGYAPIIATSIYANWKGAPDNVYVPGLYSSHGNGGNNSGGGHGKPHTKCERTNNRPPFCPKPPLPPNSDVPGPLGLFGIGAAYAFSRKLRSRINKI